MKKENTVLRRLISGFIRFGSLSAVMSAVMSREYPFFNDYYTPELN